MEKKTSNQPKIMVIGVGGAGINSIARMQQINVVGVSCATLGTSDKKAEGIQHIMLTDGGKAGDGCGGDPEIGKNLAKKKESPIKEILNGQDMVIIVAGLGRGTGTGASTVVAEIANEMKILTAGVVSIPFCFEGKRRRYTAQEGLETLLGIMDCVVVIHNDRLMNSIPHETGIKEAFVIADDTLRKAVQGISDLVYIPGEVNTDFADLCTTITQGGRAIIGMGEAEGQNRAMEALEKAINSPLLNMGFDGARRVLLNMTGGNDLTLREANMIGNEISRAINNPDANIIWGTVCDPQYNGRVKVTVFATDFVNVDKTSRNLGAKRGLSPVK